MKTPDAVAVVKIPPGARITSRMPTPEEREALDLGEGVPVLVVVLPGDRFTVEVAED